MKIAAKKTYCPACRRLVQAIEQKNNGYISINCSLCGRVLWTWDGFSLHKGKRVA